jgi:hypothetical protein
VSELGAMEVPTALQDLTLFRDPHLSMQAFNLAIVDGFLNDLEGQVLRRLIDEERTPIDDAMFLNAQSQMWIFAAYEVMRTWRQRAKDVIKWHANSGLHLKLAALEEDQGYRHPGNESRAAMLRDVIADPALVDGLRDDVKRTHVLFVRMEYLRVSLAKHEVSRKAKMLAIAPGYGRVNSWCGALDYELNSGRYVLGYINRRDIADSLRAIPSLPVPTDEELESFDAFMKGPAD